MFRAVIPARYASSRLPGKVLLSISGKPMLQWVYERARASQAGEVLIATDDLLVVSAAHSFGADTVMTQAAHPSGTDRIAEVARARGWPDTDIVVNVQGDEPLLPPVLLNQVAQLLQRHDDADIATLSTGIRSAEELLDPNTVKVVTDATGRALYFSRAPIPWDRDGAAAGLMTQKRYACARRHIGLYAYRVRSLLHLAALAPSPLEQTERLEQLRALEGGMQIRVAEAREPPGPDVNTAADLERVSAALRRQRG